MDRSDIRKTRQAAERGPSGRGAHGVAHDVEAAPPAPGRRRATRAFLLACAALSLVATFASEGSASEGSASEGSRAAPAVDPAAPDPQAPRATMRQVFDEMKRLVPLALDENRWSTPAVRAEVLASLDRVARAADLLERHGRGREVGFGALALDLGADLHDARDYYAAGSPEQARFFLVGSLQRCVSCHTRLPSSRSFPMAEELTEQPALQRLEPHERAWLHVMVRRFDRALEAWESLIADPEVSPVQLDTSGLLEDYLNVVLRVEMDVPRARRTLAKLAKRQDLPIYLAHRIQRWRTALDELDADRFATGAPASVALGAELAERASGKGRGPSARDGLVDDLAAASQLVRFLEQARASEALETREPTPEERRERARAYYWLGVVEARSLDGFWVSLAERHLEAAIRADPRGPVAEQAYAQLEEIQILGYGGASGEELPADVWTDLRELRSLMGLE